MNARSTDHMLADAAKRFGTPCYVYFTDAIDRRIAALDTAFDARFGLSFAVKSNPNPAMLEWLAPRIPWLDISSIGELRLAMVAGWEPARLSFTGPAKRDGEIAEAIAMGLGELVVESLREATVANAIAGSMGRRQDILIRIAPDRVPRGFGDQMAGRPSPFGIDLEDAPEQLPHILALPHLRVAGLHIYSGTQSLHADAVIENYRNFIAMFEALAHAYRLTPDKLVFGSGLGIPYHAGDAPLDLARVADAILPALDALAAKPAFAQTRFALELGRYLVGEAGYFVTRVVSTKQSRGTRILLCDGGMNNHLPASGHFGMVVRRAYPMHRVGGGGALERVDVVGPLCTSIDRLASGIELPHVEPGDLIAIHNSGAYGLSASPVHFIAHPLPAEVMVDRGRMRAIARDWEAHRHPVRARLVDHDAA